jgi:hypothetical protein
MKKEKAVTIILASPTNPQFDDDASSLDARIPVFHILQNGPTLSQRTHYFTSHSLLEASDIRHHNVILMAVMSGCLSFVASRSYSHIPTGCVAINRGQRLSRVRHFLKNYF